MSDIHSQTNLYAILDAVGFPARVGDGVLTLGGSVQVNDGSRPFSIELNPVLEGIKEENDSMWVVLKAEDLGMIFKAVRGRLDTLTLINLRSTECRAYVKSGNLSDLLAHSFLGKSRKVDWVLDVIEY